MSINDTPKTGKVDGHPVEIIGATRWSYWVRTLDGSLIITDEPFGFKGADSNGFVDRARVILDEPSEECEECPWDHESTYCHECIERAL
jgi:hypothetical protein